KRRLMPRGTDPSDLGIFYYDERGGMWRQIEALAEPDGRVLVAASTHFTDLISATLAKPDHPSLGSFGTNTRSEHALGHPPPGISLIQPPKPSYDGSARLSYPIEVPPGRHGMEPHLALVYDSERQNGPMGVGWDIPLSKIEVDTRFGAPTFKPDQ